MVERILGALRLDAPTYQEIDRDEGLTGEAFAVAAIVGAVGGLLGWLIGEGSFVSLIGGAIGAVIGLVIGAGILLLVGKLFGGQADYLGLLRTLAYASVPGALSGIPFIGFIASLYAFVCAVVAVRESHAVGTGVAVVIVLIPAAIIIGIVIVFAILFGLAIAGLSV